MLLDPLKENLLRRAVIGDLVTRSADRFRDRVFLMTDKERISYRTLNEKSKMAANAFLALGIKRGDRVAFMTHNCLNYLYCYFGLAKIGAVSVPLNFMLKVRRLPISSAMLNQRPFLWRILWWTPSSAPRTS